MGPVLENEDQRGLAHFMEHMSFNGTKHFPKNELVNYLQKSGVFFRQDGLLHFAFKKAHFFLGFTICFIHHKELSFITATC